MVCDSALGIAVAPAPGVREAAPGKFSSHEIALIRPEKGKVTSDLRLDIASWGTTKDRNDTRAAAAGMNRLVHGLVRKARAAVIGRAVRYGGAPGMLALGLPGGLGPVTAIVLAHAGAVYKILAPGRSLATDQLRMLSSLRFIPRVGAFPPANPRTFSTEAQGSIPLHVMD